MEAPSLKHSRRARNRKKKDKKSLKLGARSLSPSRNLGITKRVIKRKYSSNHVKNIKTCCVSSFENISEPNISLSPNPATVSPLVQRHPLDETINLVDCDNSINSLNSSVLVMPSLQIDRKDVVIDLSKDIPQKEEVIDLTNPGKECGEPTVIDISEDDSNNEQNSHPENDEISVIGTFSRHSYLMKKYEFPTVIPFKNKLDNFNNLLKCSEKLKKKYLKKRSILDKIDNKNMRNLTKKFCEPKKGTVKVAKIGMNVYVNSPVTMPSSGLRPIIIDGSNVAFVRSNCNFSCKRLQTCINYFKEKGHKVTAFVPQFRLNSKKSDNPELLRKLEKEGDVVLTPSKKVDGRNIVPYDDRFIVQTAVLKGGIIVTRDNYNDLLKENPAWAETIKYRTLAFTWVDDVLMFPSDPLGEYGPSLEEFLRFQ